MNAWKKVNAATGIEYHHEAGFRVYKQPRKPFCRAAWNVNQIDGGIITDGQPTLRAAREYVEKRLIAS